MGNGKAKGPSVASIIFLHGASSSGKSTIAKALQDQIEVPFWHISIDHLRDAGVLPTARFRNGDFRWSAARAAFFDGFHGSLKAYADAGNNLILEHILDTEGWLETLSHLFADHDVLFAAVHCPLERLIEREQARGDRPVGSAQQDYETIHLGKVYDLHLDSTAGTPGNVERLLQCWRGGARASSFSQARS
jgi:chloramphenicol 3-O phosphotransferase